jgi:hypothetical protein
MFAFTYAQIGDLIWFSIMAIYGAFVAIATPKALQRLDKGFLAKRQNNPEAAAKQVRLFRVLGVCFALCGVGLIILKLTGN